MVTEVIQKTEWAMEEGDSDPGLAPVSAFPSPMLHGCPPVLLVRSGTKP